MTPRTPNSPLTDGPSTVPPNEILVWTLRVSDFATSKSALLALLADEEVARAERFVFAKDCLAFVVARAGLRTLVGRFLDTSPQSVCFLTNDFGKPYLAMHELHFNVSHSGDVVLIAICRDYEVGVDVEWLRDLNDVDQLITQFFSPREAHELVALPRDQLLAAFFACWTRKEAYIKARGQGLSLPLNEFDVPTHPGAAKDWYPVQSREMSNWFVRSIAIDHGYAGALCAPGADFLVRDVYPGNHGSA